MLREPLNRHQNAINGPNSTNDVLRMSGEPGHLAPFVPGGQPAPKKVRGTAIHARR